MNCNSNKVPLSSVKSGKNCYSNCTNKNIYIKCRQIQIPSGQEILGVEGDKGSNKRVFILPSVNESDIDLTDKIFTIVSINSNKKINRNEISTDNITISGNSISILWEPTTEELSVDGNLILQIEASGENFQWSTLPALFIISNSINEDMIISSDNTNSKVHSNSVKVVNCNSNKTQIINSSSSSTCGSPCAKKEIYIKCREIKIPSGQEVLGVKGDNNSVEVKFVLPSVNESDIDLTNKKFYIVSVNSNNQKYKKEVDSDNINISGNSIVITWKPSIYELGTSGKLNVQIEAVDDEFQWSTYPGTFLIEKSIDDSVLDYPDILFDYNLLMNKPKINSVELIGNRSLEELGIVNDKNFYYKQLTSSDVWVITHNLNKYPSVTVLDSSGTEVVGDIHYDSENQCTLTFKGAFKGSATLN